MADKKTGLEIVVSATDRATAKFKEINKKFANSGLGKLNNSLRLLKGASGLNQFGKAMGNLGRANSNAANEFQGLLFKLSALVGVGGGGLFLLTKEFSDFSDNVQDSAERLDFSTGGYQKYAIGAKLAGLETEKFNLFVNKFSRSVGDAMLTGGEAAKVFQKLKVTFKGRSKEDVFAQVMTRLSQLPDAFKRNAAIAKIFGKNFGALTPYIKDFVRYTKEAEGFIISEEDIARGDVFQDQLNYFLAVFSSLRKLAGASMLEGFSEGLKIFSDFLKSNKPEIKEFFTAIGKELPGAFRVFANALKSVMGFFSTFDEQTGKTSINMGRVKLVFGLIAAILAGPFIASLIAVGAAFVGLFGPVLPILAAISLKAYLIGAAFTGAAALVVKYWEPIKELFKTIWGYIGKIGTFMFARGGVKIPAAIQQAPVAQTNFLQQKSQGPVNATASLSVNVNAPKGTTVQSNNNGFEQFMLTRGYGMSTQ